MQRIDRLGLFLAIFLGAAGLASAQLPAEACHADLNGNGAVDSSDLGAVLAADPAADFDGNGIPGECFDIEYLLGNWGRCPRCAADFNASGSVDSSDLGLLLGSFGNDCRGDLNEDGVIDADDVDAFLCLFGTSGPLGDFNGDATVDSSDLGHLLGSVGTECRPDLDRDGDIDSADLNLLLGVWGSC